MILFDLRTHYQRIGDTQDRLEIIRLEAERFRYYDSLSKEEQEEFKQLDRIVRREVADEIATTLGESAAENSFFALAGSWQSDKSTEELIHLVESARTTKTADLFPY